MAFLYELNSIGPKIPVPRQKLKDQTECTELLQNQM